MKRLDSRRDGRPGRARHRGASERGTDHGRHRARRAPVAGTTLEVEAFIDSVYPVVPFEYAIQNECQLPNKGARTIQRDDIVYWTDVDGGLPHAIMPVYLQSIPEGSKCKVFLMRGNVQVKGSVTSYTVEAAP